jgi:hypothetical protein
MRKLGQEELCSLKLQQLVQLQLKKQPLKETKKDLIIKTG